jgi:hypothetical protein
VIVAPTSAVVFAGWATFGLGVAAIAPTVLGAAAGASELPAPVAIAAVTTIGYMGSFSGPPLIGALAEVAGLTMALGMLVAVSALMPVLGARLGPEPTVTK